MENSYASQPNRPPQPQPQAPYPPPTGTNYSSNSPNPWVQGKNMDPALVVVLNLLCLGLGHILMGQERKGGSIIIATFGVSFAVMIPVMLIAVLAAGPFGIFAVYAVIPLVWIWAIAVHIDGYKIAKRIKEGYPVQQGESINGFVSIGTGFLLGGRPRFHHNSEQKPREWVEAVAAYEANRARWQAAGYAYPPQAQGYGYGYGYGPVGYAPPPGGYPYAGGYAQQPGAYPPPPGGPAGQWQEPAPDQQQNDPKAWGYDQQR